MAGRSKNFLVDTGATYSVLTSYSGAFSSQTCTILGATGKKLQKYSPEHFFVAGVDKYFPTSFWWPLSVLLLPYWEEIFPCLRSLEDIAVLIEDALKLSLGGKLTIFISKKLKQLLNGRSHLWMSDQRTLRYAVVSNFETIEAKALPPGTSAQLSELIALTQALELGKGKRVAIYTNSKCPFWCYMHMLLFGKERGLLGT